jgi:hypothetical protein
MEPLLQGAGILLALGFLYLVHICHLMHRRQERMEQYIVMAARMGTVLAGSAAIGPLMAFLQRPPRRR